MKLSELQGHWRREWLRWPGGEGCDDETTRVHWLQAGSLYADVRVPADRPALDGARCLADLDPAALLQIMQAEGFAGTITLRDDVCTWHRRINWHGRPDGIDAGHVRFEDGALIEDGVHAPYRELWRRLDGPQLTASRVWAGDLEGVLVASDTVFLLGLGRPAADPSGALIEALRRGDRPEGVAAQFDSLYAFGHWHGADGIAELCTDPFLEGAPVMKRKAGITVLLRATFDGDRRAVPLDQDQSAR